VASIDSGIRMRAPPSHRRRPRRRPSRDRGPTLTRRFTAFAWVLLHHDRFSTLVLTACRSSTTTKQT
jgi:hypothetical protein